MRALWFFFSLLMILVTVLWALLSLLGVLALYIDPSQMILPAFVGLFLPAVLVVNVLLCLYWIFQKRKWAIVPIIAILMNFNYFITIFQYNPVSSAPGTNDTTIRIVTYNVGSFRSWEKKRTQMDIARYLRDAKFNIVCFQEYNDMLTFTPDSLGKYMNLPYHAVNYLSQSLLANYGTVIFSSYPIIASGKIPFPSHINDAMWADLLIGNDTVRVFNCHLQTTNFSSQQKYISNQFRYGSIEIELPSLVLSELKQNFIERARQAQMLRQAIDTTPYPVIVCGDFNDTPVSYTYHTVKGNLNDAFRENGRGYGYTFRGIRKLFRIDYILYSPAFKGHSYQSPLLEWSDHNPVFTELSLQY